MSTLTPIERNVILTASSVGLNFDTILRLIDSLDNEQEVKEVFRVARAKLLGKSPLPDHEWQTVNGIAKLLGCDWSWVRGRVDDWDYLAFKQPPISGRVVSLYPPEVVEHLMVMRLSAPPSGEDMLTTPALARLAQRSRAWCKKHLILLGIMPQLRTDRIGRVVDHWPLESVDVLVELQKKYPPADDWLTVSQIRLRLGIHSETVKSRLARLPITGEMRQTLGTNQIARHFPPSVLVFIQTCPHDDKYCRCAA